ncbi:uncharacterized protein LOC135398241 [Ornithodoros turicata]|uniref:uncharacterized protein LOC135398241 n=1 Tax=Ornithodoros turicata TaxID=34597 RepID=UPI00313A26D8
MHATLVIVAGTLLLTGNCRAQFKNISGCGDEDIDACGTDFVVFSRSPRLPEDPVELSKACEIEMKSLLCARDYAVRCLEGLAHGAALVSIGTIQEEQEKKCNADGPGQRTYFEHVQCMNKAGDELHQCVRTFQESLVKTARYAPSKQRVAYSCCQYADFYDCTERGLTDYCGRPDTTQHVMETIDNLFGNILSLVCGAYQKGSKNCLQLKPLPKINGNEKLPVGFLSPLKDIVRV